MALHSNLSDTICALATPAGVGGLGVIRLSGPDAIAIADRVFRGRVSLLAVGSHTVSYGVVVEEAATSAPLTIDEVMVTVLRAPRSFTTEDTVEFSCHGSPFILGEVLRVLCAAGARPAAAGEFTLRAFLHGRLDLTQAEAVADLIAADSAAAHQLALGQLRGGIATRISALRTQLVDFAALVELELDFVEEDVEFADRAKLQALVAEIRFEISGLMTSFRLGNALRNGVNTVIAGRPNAGKSTLLNAWLQEERAIVSEIPGTTRDTIEEVLHLDSIAFRLIDTAGIREATDAIERIGVERTYEKIRESTLLVYVFDLMTTTPDMLAADLQQLQRPGLVIFPVGNKIDLDPDGARRALFAGLSVYWLSAAHPHASLPGEGLPALSSALVASVLQDPIQPGQAVLSNLRHYEALRRAEAALADVAAGLKDLRSGELVALNIRQVLEALGEISGEVTNDELLGSICGRFCIGK